MTTKEKAILAGGCFWCMVKPFDQWDGVESVVSGYTGGHVPNPTYEQVCAGLTGHTEAVEITYDPNLISFEKILDVFWSVIDPTDLHGQFGDRGSSYRPEIFYTNDQQKEIAEKSKITVDNSHRFDAPIVVPITPASNFYRAEEHHQDFYKKDPTHYERYSVGSGRVAFIDKHKV